MSFKGLTALVAGGASGLGRATAVHLWKNGANVIVADLPRSEEAFHQDISDIQNHNPKQNKIVFSAVDVTNEDEVKEAVELAKAEDFGGLNIAVTCAGIGHAAKLVHSKSRDAHPMADFQRVLAVNTVGTFNVMRLAAQSMSYNEPNESGERGVIINTASVAAFDGQVGQTAYAASKGAIASMTLPAARELAQHGIRVVSVAPGLFLTPLLMKLPSKVQYELGAMVPFPNRLGKPEEYAQLIESIIKNPMINGETIRLDGAIRMPP